MNNQEPRFANQLNIQWFPGHMTKTLRMMEQEIQHVDASLVLLDARIPLSSLNPEIERITARKPKLYALNKADLADPAVTEEWIKYFHAADAGCVAISAKQKGGAKAVQTAIEKELSARACTASFWRRASSLPLLLTTRMPPSWASATPAESYPRYSSFSKPSSSTSCALRFPT